MYIVANKARPDVLFFFFSSRRRHTRLQGDWSSDVCSSDLKRPVIYTGGGVINSGPEASKLLRELVQATGFPITSTLMGLGAYPASGKNWLRSEEHTSELQSPCNIVCRLLLEQTKTDTITHR